MAYADPFRLRVLKALSASLEQITTANGYTHDMTGKVFRGRAFYGEGDPIPLISILEPPLPIDQLRSPLGSGASSGEWDIMIQGFVMDDKENPTDPAHRLMADVRKALAQERKKRSARNNEPRIFGLDPKSKHQVEDIFVGPGVVRPADEISAFAYFWLTMTIKLVEDLELPYE